MYTMLNLGLNTEELTITTDVTPGESTTNIETTTTVVKTTMPINDDTSTTQVDVMTTGALIGTDGTDITEGQGIITTSHAVASKAESNFRYKYILS